MASKLAPAERALIDRARAALSGGGALLDSISWPRSVEREFFAADASVLPKPSYRVDRPRAEECLRALDALERDLVGDDALVRLLRARVESQRLGARMQLAAGTKSFAALSQAAYGGANTTWLDDDTSNLDFARHLRGRLGRRVAEDDDGQLDAAGLEAFVRERVVARKGAAPTLTIAIDDELSAKAIAGKTRLRIRADATFAREEARSLYLHEVETHIFTAQNGDAHPHLDFLDSGGPLTTRTQEGLAVFAELYAQALTVPRLTRLIDRVELVAKAEDGADFLELYRFLVDDGVAPRTAFADAARVCRGGLASGGAPFTKDACYLAGLAEVYDFLRLTVRHDRHAIAEVLVSGRLSLSEVEPLLELRERGLLARPVLVPSWLRRWDDLLAHFAFASFLGEIDLGFVAKRYPWLARAEKPGA